MADSLAQWQEHRVDYRGPGLAALLLFALIGFLLPQDWLDLPWLGGPGRLSEAPAEFDFAPDEGLQILDVEILAPVPVTVSLEPPASPERVEITLEPVPDSSDLAGEGEFSWDPTHAYRGGEELLVPDPLPGSGAPDDILRRLEFLLSMDGAASYTLGDTSQIALGHSNFFRLQRELFARNAPGWAYEKAVERYKETMGRMLFDNPLRGPQ
jgi:hypothetical protein